MNDSKLLQFYEDELAYLASAGSRFAQAHPDRAALVSLENVESRDPDVERLIESFAFLAGQIRAELHNELPELTHSLLKLFWPHYLRMIPATTTVEFQPDVDQISNRLRLSKGEAFVESKPIRSQGGNKEVVCLFQNRFDVDLYPLEIRDVRLEKSHQASTVVVDFELGSNAADVDWMPLRLHLAGDPVVALEMRHWLLNKARENGIRAEVEQADGGMKSVALPPLSQVGLKADDAVLDDSSVSFPGYRLIQEYFALRAKFLYVEVTGLKRLNSMAPIGRFSLKIPLKSHPPDRIRFDKQSIRLYCCPAVNRFGGSAIPIRYDGAKSEYELIPDHNTDAYAIYAVQRVLGQPQGSPRVVEYQDFLHFRSEVQSGQPYYHVNVRAQAGGRLGWWLSLASPGDVLPEQLLSVDLECTNGTLPAALLPGDVCFRNVGVPDFVRVSNLTQPEGMLTPPIDSASEWRFISHLALNYMSLEDRDALIGALKLYDWTPRHVNWRRLQGIRSLTSKTGTAVVQRVPLRGRELLMDLDVSHFANEADAHLFSEVLCHFLALYANINSYVRLTTRFSTGEEIRWPALNGSQRPL